MTGGEDTTFRVMTDGDHHKTFRAFLGVPPEAVYAAGKVALAASRVEMLLRGLYFAHVGD